MKKIHIFKTGKHTDSHGTTVNFTEADLHGAIAAYDPSLHQAPIVVGHPKNEDRAFGWIQSMSGSGGDLYAHPDQVNPEFSEQVQTGAYKKVSASWYLPDSPNNPKQGSYYLRHVGFLGAQPPAIKGLKPIEFSEADECITLELDFSEKNPPHPPFEKGGSDSVFHGLKRFFTWAMGGAAADFSEQDNASDSLPASKAIPPNPPLRKGGATNLDKPDIPKTEPTQEPTMTPEEIAAMQAENDALKKEKADNAAKQAQAKAAAAHQANADFAENLVNDGKMTPANKEFVVAILDGLDAGGTDKPLEFGEGDDSQPLVKAVKDWLASGRAHTLLFGEVAGKDTAPPAGVVDFGENVDADSVDDDARVREYMKANDVSYGAAARAVLG